MRAVSCGRSRRRRGEAGVFYLRHETRFSRAAAPRLLPPSDVLLRCCVLPPAAAPRQIMASISVLLAGIFMATVTDDQVASNGLGMTIAALNVFVTSLYQVCCAAGPRP